MKSKNGISLIVLIITIIVVIILAAAVILTISNNNPVSSAKEATFKSDIRSFQEELSMYNANQMITDYSGSREKLTMTEIPTLEEMKKYIENYSKKYTFKDGDEYKSKLGIEEDELVYYADKVTEDEKKWLDELGIRPSSYTVPEANEECFIWSGNDITGYYEEKLKSYLQETNGQLKIPKRCTGIGDSVFRGNEKITEVFFQDSDNGINIGRQPFVGCSNLRYIYFSKNVNSMQSFNIFHGCNSLMNIEVAKENNFLSSQDGILYDKAKKTLIAFPGGRDVCENIPSTVTTIGEYSFVSAVNLKSIEIPEGIISIESYAFDRISSLQSVSFPNTLQKIRYGAFYNTSLSGVLTIPNNVITIEDQAFSHTQITKVILGSKLSAFIISSFYDCKNLKEYEVNTENNYFSSYDGILYNKNRTEIIRAPEAIEINNLYIPNFVTKVGNEAFRSCKNISGDIYIPEGVTTIGSSCFNETSLFGIAHVSSTVIDINNYSFSDQKSIEVDNNNQNYSSQDGILYDKLKTTLIKAPTNVEINNLTLPNSLINIENSALHGCKKITGTLTLNDGLQTIGSQAFDATSITGEVYIPLSVSNIEIWAFSGSNNITKLKCAATTKPTGWDDYWNSNCNDLVEWGSTRN